MTQITDVRISSLLWILKFAMQCSLQASNRTRIHLSVLVQYFNFKCTLYVCLFLETGSHQDDEYAWAGVQDPKIMITTSHNPSSRLKQFAKVKKKHY